MRAFEELPPSLKEDLHHVQNNAGVDLNVQFSTDAFFHNETLSVSIYASDPDAVIYYTTDSSTPTVADNQFAEPLVFEAGEILDVVVLKAIAIKGDEISRVRTQTFFIGTVVHERFTTQVFSINTDAENLYDYDYGIFVPGRVRTEWIEANPGENWEGNARAVHANYEMRGREWERPAHIEVFTRNGERVIAQNAGLRVHGGSSRVRPQKSLRLIARREYEPDSGMFRHEFFGSHVDAGLFGMPIMSYDTIVLRNEGDQASRARIRNSLVAKIAQETGFPTVTPVSGAAVFLNGEYYGYLATNIRINGRYLQSLYNAPENSFQIENGGFTGVWTDNEELREEFEQLFELARQRPVDDSTMQALEDFFDIDNLLHYYAIQIYIANADWHTTNIRMWRYTGSLDAENLAPELDGRWRYILFDFDLSMNSGHSSGRSDTFFPSLMRTYTDRRAPIFPAILQTPEHAETFSNYICDLAFEHFSVNNVEKIIDDISEIVLQELAEYQEYAHSNDIEGNLFSPSHRRRILNFARLRPSFSLDELRGLFGYTNTFRIVSDDSVKINTLNGNEGVYFIENSVPVTPVLPRGHVLDHWIVSGEVRYDEELRISAEYADKNGVVHIQAVTRPEYPPLFFKDTFDNGELFGFTMYNPTGITQSTAGLFLSDDIHELKRWQFPALNILPGNTWEFVGRNSTCPDVLLRIGLNFNPRVGEVIFLSNEDGDILDYITMQP
jgi:hypothetical protein